MPCPPLHCERVHPQPTSAPQPSPCPGPHLRHHCCPPGHLPVRNTRVTQQRSTVCCNHMHCVATECHLCTIPLRTAHAATGCTLLRCRATGYTRSNPSKRSETKAPLAASRGVCAALWTRIGSDVSEAVRLAAPRIPAAGRARATGSRDSVDVRVAGFGSEQPRPTSALCLGLRLGLRVGPRTRAQPGPTALRSWPRRDGASMSAEVDPCLLLGEGCPGWRCHWCGVPPLGGGVPA